MFCYKEDYEPGKYKKIMTGRESKIYREKYKE